MIVLILERAKPSLRGELTRWLAELKAGVYVGTVSARVRDLLWMRVEKGLKDGAAFLIYPAPTEQGFTIRTLGTPGRRIEDFEGLLLPQKRVSR